MSELPIFVDREKNVLTYGEAWEKVEGKFKKDQKFFEDYAKTELGIEYIFDWLRDTHPEIYEELISYESGLSFIDSCDETGDEMLKKYFGLKRIYPGSPEYTKYVGSNAKKPASRKPACHGASCKCASCAAKRKKKIASAPKKRSAATSRTGRKH